ncbi:Hypothetical predicted protein [Pelobates cultripes]|uniref:Uncharacterized protein n=1 Tax=Pelobates cultripes TaxID=61616 RepID=A0AAD1VSD2_PELCU|nr:Hypothetical predicted protein [Pelobates cultripes]
MNKKQPAPKIGCNKKADHLRPLRSTQSGSQLGPMNGFLHIPSSSQMYSGSKMTPLPLTSLETAPEQAMLAQKNEDLLSLAATVVTKFDLQAHSEDLHGTISLDMTHLRMLRAGPTSSDGSYPN